MEAVNTVAQKIGAAMYQEQAAPKADDTKEDGTSKDDSTKEEKKDDDTVVEGEVEENK